MALIETRRIYVAAPLGANDAGRPARIARAAEAGRRLQLAGYDAFVPHHTALLYHDADAMHGYDQWLAWCLRWLSACDALLRIPGHSPGADLEVERMRELGRPVFFFELGLRALEARAPYPGVPSGFYQ